MSLGSKILSLRQQHKITQKELAEKLNVTDKAVSRWENDKNLPDVEMIRKLSNVFEITITELFDSIENIDINDEEKYDFDKIWIYKRNSIISHALLITSLLFLLFIKFFLPLTGNEQVDFPIKFLNSFLFFCAFITFILGILINIISFLKLYLFSLTKYYRLEYYRALIKYLSISLIILILIILNTALLFIF